MIYVLLFLFGIAIGSFLNVLVLRVNTGVSVRGRSRCFSCLKKLGWHDLVPLFSYVVIRGKCRYCGSGISAQYPLVELAGGIIFVLVALVFPSIVSEQFVLMDVVQYILAVSFFSLLLAITVYDIRHKIIPDQFSATLFVIAVVTELVYLWSIGSFAPSEWIGDVLAAIGIFSFFGGIWLISKGEWMGFGDAKLSISLGLFLGFPAIFLAFLIAIWSGAIYGIIMIFARGYKFKTEVPFAPFLATGSLAAFLLMWSPLSMILYRYINII
ncbi:MAG: prepilin peptidase [bacterium]|nr:prepilin peptidase [bacterium]